MDHIEKLQLEAEKLIKMQEDWIKAYIDFCGQEGRQEIIEDDIELD